MDSLLLAVVAGLAVGISIIAIFAIIPVQSSQNPIIDEPQDIPDIVWMGRSPTQCAEPWDDEKWRNVSNGTFDWKVSAMRAFLAESGITVNETRIVENSEFDGENLVLFEEMARCEACGCLAWHTIFIRVSSSDIGHLESLGFHRYSGNFSEVAAR